MGYVGSLASGPGHSSRGREVTSLSLLLLRWSVPISASEAGLNCSRGSRVELGCRQQPVGTVVCQLFIF
jgi:hypothetical protein